jgi:hypothetical protein
MQQAANLAKLRDLQTPLLGGENPELVGMDYSGIVPQRSTAATPNPLAAAAAAAGMTPAGPGATPALGRAGSGSGGLLGATPGRSGSGSIAGVASTPSALAIAGGATPGGAALLASVRGGGGIPGATPMRIRDQFGLNEGLGEGLEGASLRAQKAAAAALRSDLRAGLAGLPAPENEYSVALPELPDDEAEVSVEEDAADVKARKAREAEAARQAEERKKSQVGDGSCGLLSVVACGLGGVERAVGGWVAVVGLLCAAEERKKCQVGCCVGCGVCGCAQCGVLRERELWARQSGYFMIGDGSGDCNFSQVMVRHPYGKGRCAPGFQQQLQHMKCSAWCACQLCILLLAVMFWDMSSCKCGSAGCCILCPGSCFPLK